MKTFTAISIHFANIHIPKIINVAFLKIVFYNIFILNGFLYQLIIPKKIDQDMLAWAFFATKADLIAGLFRKVIELLE